MNRKLLLAGAAVLIVAATAVYFMTGTTAPDAPATIAASAPEGTVAGDMTARNPEELMDAARDAFLGDGVTQDDAQGAALLLQAASAGHPRAIDYAGTLFMGGIGVDLDVTKAREWLSKSKDAEARKLAEELMSFEAVLATMPEHQARMEKELARQEAHEQIRSSFIAALEREKTAEEQAAQGTETSAQ